MVLFYDILKKQIFDDLKANAHVISMMNPEDLPDEINYNLNKDCLLYTSGFLGDVCGNEGRGVVLAA